MLRRRLCSRILTVGLLAMGINAGAHGTEPREETGFGSNPGNLRMFSYVPGNVKPSAPLIVVLHGCKQTAGTFVRDAGWLALADTAELALLMPEQKGLPSIFYDFYVFPWVTAMFGANNQNACFNWFESEDTKRDRGEALSIRQMIDAMVRSHTQFPFGTRQDQAKTTAMKCKLTHNTGVPHDSSLKPHGYDAPCRRNISITMFIVCFCFRGATRCPDASCFTQGRNIVGWYKVAVGTWGIISCKSVCLRLLRPLPSRCRALFLRNPPHR